ncbi:PDZ domain-containing protein [Gemmatimonadota bacterium]
MKPGIRISGAALLMIMALAGPAGAQDPVLSAPEGVVPVDRSGPTDIAYTVDLTRQSAHLMDVTVRLSGLDRDDVRLVMPSWTRRYRIRHFAQNIMQISAESDEGYVLEVSQSALGEWLIDTADVAEAFIRYTLYTNDPSPHAAQLDETHAFFNPAAVLMYLPDHMHDPVMVALQMPTGWAAAAPLEPTFDPAIFRADSYLQLVQSPILAARYQELFFTVEGEDFGGMNVMVVLDGALPGFNVRGYQQGLERLVTKAIELFDVPPGDSYLFTVHFSDDRINEGVGYPFAATIHWGVHSRETGIESLLQTSLEAFLHAWLGGMIQPERDGEVDFTTPPVDDSLWFLDGVAAYYAELLMTRTGLKPPDAFFARIGSEITRLQNTPARLTQSLARASEEVWYRDDDRYRLPTRSIDHHNKGFLLALQLDLKMRRATENRQSLDDLMAFLTAWYGRGMRMYEGSRAIVQTAGALAEIDLDSFLEQYVNGTTELPFETILAQAGWDMEIVVEEVAATGFRTEVEGPDMLAVTDVEEHSPAARAGLRSGDRILAVNGSVRVGDLQDIVALARPEDNITLRIRRMLTEEEITFALGMGNRQTYVIGELPVLTLLQQAIGSGLLIGLP